MAEMDISIDQRPPDRKRMAALIYAREFFKKQESLSQDKHINADATRSMVSNFLTTKISKDIPEEARQLHERLYKPLREDEADNVSGDKSDKDCEEKANKVSRLANYEVLSCADGFTTVRMKNYGMDDEDTQYTSIPTPPLSPTATMLYDPWLTKTYEEDEEKTFLVHDPMEDSDDAVLCGGGKPLRCQCLGSRCDPMWSSVGQEIAGIACEEKFATDPLVTHDPMFGPCVDPSVVSLPPLSIPGYPLSSDAKKTSLNIFPGYPPTAPTSPTTVPMDTPSASESDENDEIDVVSVCDDSGQSPYLSGSSSASAHVAAIHNYSSHQAAPVKSSVRSAAASPPHIPTPPSRRKDKRATNRSHRTSPYTPASPANRRTQKNGGGVDMHKVAQKLGRIPAGSNHRTTHGAGSGEENEVEDTEGKRAQHNVLERERRNCLKNQFFNLRDVVPEIANQERAAKVVILKKAILYCSELRAQEKLVTSQYALERKRFAMLKQQLGVLLSERKQALAQLQRT